MNTLEVRNIKKTFKLSRKQQKIEKTKTKLKVAVDNLSFIAYPGEIFGLLPPTIISPSSGFIKVEIALKQVVLPCNE